MVQKFSHLTMPCWMALSCSHWACSAFFTFVMKAVSCRFHWSVNSMMAFKSSASCRRIVTWCLLFVQNARGTKDKGAAVLPLKQGKGCSALQSWTSSARWYGASSPAAASSHWSPDKHRGTWTRLPLPHLKWLLLSRVEMWSSKPQKL